MKKIRNGFSLIELLAVIILLGIISLIIVPSVIKTIENAKKDSFEKSVAGLISASVSYMGDSDFEDWPVSGLAIPYIKENKLFSAKNLKNFTGGILYNNNGTITVENITDGNYCANGKKNSLTITKGNCS